MKKYTAIIKTSTYSDYHRHYQLREVPSVHAAKCWAGREGYDHVYILDTDADAVCELVRVKGRWQRVEPIYEAWRFGFDRYDEQQGHYVHLTAAEIIERIKGEC